MMFMTMYKYAPENRDAVLKRRLEGPFHAEGTKYLGEWVCLTSNIVFRLVDVDDPRSLLAGAHAWTDLGALEAFPVMSGDEVLKQFSAKK
jgi:hypothetical protein